MISFKQFIKEDGELPTSPHEIAALIKNNCQPFLKESKCLETGEFLTRGLKNIDAPFTIFYKRQRKPKDSAMWLHQALDNHLYKEFGARFRSEGTFATGDNNVAAGYGSVFAMFPINNFKYCWSKKVEDAYEFFDDRPASGAQGAPHIRSVLSEKFSENEITEMDWPEAVREYLEIEHPYINTDLDTAITYYSSNEVMIHCESYYALRYNKNFFNVIKELSR